MLFDKRQTLSFVESCYEPSENRYKLTPNSEPTPFGLPFAIFIYFLLGNMDHLDYHSDIYYDSLISALNEHKFKRNRSVPNLAFDKSNLQLLSFTLSALSILGKIFNSAPVNSENFSP